MKTIINNDRGVVTYAIGSGTDVEGLNYADDRWDDQYAFIDQGTGPAALTYEGYRDTGFFMRFFRHNQDDNIFMIYQLSHQWDPTTAVHAHMHCIPMSSGSGVVKFNYAYSWCMVSGTLPAASGWTSGSITASYTPADQYVQNIIAFGEIAPPDGATESAILVFKVERPGSSDVVDTYETGKPQGTAAANLGVLFFDLHYRKHKPGTQTRYPENGH